MKCHRRQTTNIPAARQAGVEVSLGVDWNPTGSDHIFDELRTAAEVNEEDFGGAIPDSDWIKLITVNPARALALEEQVGRLAPGLKADITVLRAQQSDPTKSLLGAHLQDVQMVWVGGNLLYANNVILDKVKPGQCEALLVHGSQKRVCVKDMQHAVPKATETLAQIREAQDRVDQIVDPDGPPVLSFPGGGGQGLPEALSLVLVPLISGSDKSRITTSVASWRLISTPSRPFLASPTTSIDGSSRKTAFMPSRKSG